jgi:hypothetical protein
VTVIIPLQFFLQTSNCTNIKNFWHKTKISLFQTKNIYLYILFNEHIIQQLASMSDNIIPSFITLSVELVYRILDKMDGCTMLCSMQSVCTRIDTILHTYHRYQVNFFFNLMSHLYHLESIIHSYTLYIISVAFFLSILKYSFD